MPPQRATPINDRVGVINDNGHWTYLLGMHPVYGHPAADRRGFKLAIAQLVDCGACRQVEILTAFGISKSNLDRGAVALPGRRHRGVFRADGEAAPPRAGAHPGSVAGSTAVARRGPGKPAVAARLGVPLDTLRRAVWDGRLSAPPHAGAPPARARASGCSRHSGPSTRRPPASSRPRRCPSAGCPTSSSAKWWTPNC